MREQRHEKSAAARLEKGNRPGGKNYPLTTLDAMRDNINKNHRLRRLIEQTRCDDWVEQKEAARRLGDLGSTEALPALIDLFSHEVIPVRIQAVRAVIRLGDASALPRLRLLTTSVYSSLRGEACEALASFPDSENLPMLAASIFDTDREVQVSAFESLKRNLDWLSTGGELEDNLEPLLSLTRRIFDESMESNPFHSRVIKEVSRYLGHSGKRRAMGELRKIAEKGLPSARAAGLRALGRLAAHSSLELFIRGLESEHREIRLASAEGLASLGNSKSVPVLVEALEKNGDREELRLIGEALVETGTEEAETALIKLLKRKKLSGQIIASNLLGEMGSQRALGPLTALFLKTGNRIIRDAATEAIAKLGSRSSLQPLLDALREKNSHVRSNAVRILGAIGKRDAIEVLAVAMDDDIDTGVRNRAEDALIWITEKLASEGNVGDYYFLESILPKLNREIRPRFRRLCDDLKKRTRDPVILDESTAGEDDAVRDGKRD